MPDYYPWYEVVKGDHLEQGDILFECPVLMPAPSLTFPLPSEDLPVDILTRDVIVMTQSCDLVNDKVQDVMLCPHWHIDEASKADQALGKADAHKEVAKGRRPRYMMLEESGDSTVLMGKRIVDFGRAFSLPKQYTKQFADENGQRLRLCPPYREHLSQGFAKFFMRVGLPQDIEFL